MKIDRLYRINSIVDLVQESTGKELNRNWIKLDRVLAWTVGVIAALFWTWVLIRIYG